MSWHKSCIHAGLACSECSALSDSVFMMHGWQCMSSEFVLYLLEPYHIPIGSALIAITFFHFSARSEVNGPNHLGACDI